jgi:hypothetical protein
MEGAEVMQATVEFDLGFFPLMWILFFVKPWISINGNAQQMRWGVHTLTLAPGNYHFEAWYPYMFSSQQSLGSRDLVLHAGGHYRLRYRPAWLVFLAGSLDVIGQPALPPGM